MWTVNRFAFVSALMASANAFAQSTPPLKSLDCMPHLTAPMIHGPWVHDGNNAGLRVTHFIDLTVHDKSITVIQGVDLSRYNFFNYAPLDMVALKKCGAEYAFIEISGEREWPDFQNVRMLWKNALEAGIEVYPYHFLGVSAVNRFIRQGLPGRPYPYPEYSEDWKALQDLYVDEGRAQAKRFLTAYDTLNPVTNGSALKFPKYVAVDVEEPLSVKHRLGDVAANEYAQAYVEMACSFIDEIRAVHKDITVLLYTSVQMQREYNLGNLSYTNGDCLKGVPVWLAFPTRSGGHPADLPGDKNGDKVNAKALCFAQSDPTYDRCRFHQYTSTANLGYQDHRKTSPKNKPLYLDLDRYHTAQFDWN